MAKVIVYQDPETGRAVVLVPAYHDRARPQGDTGEALLRRIIERSVPRGPDGAQAAYWVVEEALLPTDRTFRDAWRCAAGTVDVDLPKARGIHMDAIRRARDEALSRLDAPYLEAVEKGDAGRREEVARRKQALRDIPQTFDLAPAATPEELEDLWPPDLARPDLIEPQPTPTQPPPGSAAPKLVASGSTADPAAAQPTPPPLAAPETAGREPAPPPPPPGSAAPKPARRGRTQ